MASNIAIAGQSVTQTAQEFVDIGGGQGGPRHRHPGPHPTSRPGRRLTTHRGPSTVMVEGPPFPRLSAGHSPALAHCAILTPCSAHPSTV